MEAKAFAVSAQSEQLQGARGDQPAGSVLSPGL